MTTLAAITATKLMMFMTLMALRMIYPGPASDFCESVILLWVA